MKRILVAYDGSAPARRAPLRPSGLARQAPPLLDALGLPTVDVRGVSFGGGVAQERDGREPGDPSDGGDAQANRRSSDHGAGPEERFDVSRVRWFVGAERLVLDAELLLD